MPDVFKLSNHAPTKSKAEPPLDKLPLTTYILRPNWKFETCLNANANAAGVWTCVKGSCLNSALDFTLFTTMVSTHVADAGLKQCIL